MKCDVNLHCPVVLVCFRRDTDGCLRRDSAQQGFKDMRDKIAQRVITVHHDPIRQCSIDTEPVGVDAPDCLEVVLRKRA